MITTTLNRIRNRKPCGGGWAKLLKHLGKTQPDDEPLPFSVILESNGREDAIWCCRAEPEFNKEWRLFAVWCARQVRHLMKDSRSIAALDVAERFAKGNATTDKLAAAEAAAWAAARNAACDAARNAAEAAAWAATEDAAEAAAWAATEDAAWAAARNAARNAAWAAACDAACDAARNAACDAQTSAFLHLVTHKTLPPAP